MPKWFNRRPESGVEPDKRAEEEESEERVDPRAGIMDRLKEGLRRSRESLGSSVVGIFDLHPGVDPGLWDEIEEALIQADVGVEVTTRVVEAIKERAGKEHVSESSRLKEILREELVRSFGKACAKAPGDARATFLVVGVNGTGKTTTIAKLAYLHKKMGGRVILGAADTFRAAAVEQLDAWANRLGVDIVKHERGSDPAAVVYDAIHAAGARGATVLIIDTAGRLHTYVNLMEELKKIKRIAEREGGSSTVHSLLVIDATTGQNGIAQARLFDEALRIDGIVLTKLDGTAKGGIALAIVEELGIPIEYVGFGEQMEDLQLFDAVEFVDALVGTKDDPEDRYQ